MKAAASHGPTVRHLDAVIDLLAAFYTTARRMPLSKPAYGRQIVDSPAKRLIQSRLWSSAED
jgi:hypothetical protein